MEKIATYTIGGYALRFTPSGKLISPHAESADTLKDMIQFLNFGDVRSRDVEGIRAGVWQDLFYQHQALRIGVGQRAKKYSVHDAEDGGVRADAKSKGEDGHGGKTRAFAKHSCAKAQILVQLVEEGERSSLAAFFFDALDSAKFNSCPAHRLLARHAFVQQVLCTRLDVETKFRVHLALHSRTPESCLQPGTEPAPQSHTSSSLLLQIPASICDFIRASARRWDRPASLAAPGNMKRRQRPNRAKLRPLQTSRGPSA